ncbi:MAG: hypothetical protein N2053_13065, partial [Chitinispirillaceae bacterium]|nr:hypothetical protein [Chitinispirillaceae bacterium]
TIERIEDLKEEFGMLETKFKKWEESVYEKGIEKGIEKERIEIAEKLIERGVEDEEIRIITGLSLNKILEVRKRKNRNTNGR